LFIENRPYIVGGFSQHDSLACIQDKVPIGSKFSSEVLNGPSKQDALQNILSMADKYKYMKETVKKRLTFGKDLLTFLLLVSCTHVSYQGSFKGNTTMSPLFPKIFALELVKSYAIACNNQIVAH